MTLIEALSHIDSHLDMSNKSCKALQIVKEALYNQSDIKLNDQVKFLNKHSINKNQNDNWIVTEVFFDKVRVSQTKNPTVHCMISVNNIEKIEK
jgi:hypothetical protein